jgi:hypothetical protein
LEDGLWRRRCRVPGLFGAKRSRRLGQSGARPHHGGGGHGASCSGHPRGNRGLARRPRAGLPRLGDGFDAAAAGATRPFEHWQVSAAYRASAACGPRRRDAAVRVRRGPTKAQGAAPCDATPELRNGQPKDVAEHPEEWLIRRQVDLPLRAVHDQGDQRRDPGRGGTFVRASIVARCIRPTMGHG